MNIDHIAIWSNNIEQLKEFYQNYFNAKANKKYRNESKNFESYFLSFPSGSRLEIMHNPDIPENLNDTIKQYLGIIHFAIKVNGKENVDQLTARLKSDGHKILSEPRKTGDGYYESCILDPDNNRLEIVA